MILNFLSKSDFKVAQTCPSKLYYKKHKFPSDKEENEYLEMLADGGYMIGHMAKLIYPDGFEISHDDVEKAITETKAKLKEENIILFEPAIYINNKLIRIDVLIKEGKKLKLIEVKSKSFDSEEAKENSRYFYGREWTEYLEDVAYQKIVLTEKFPEYKIESYLLIPDKSKTSNVEGMIGWFTINEVEIKKSFRKPIVSFNGDINALRKNHILSLVNVDEYVDRMIPDLKPNIEKYIDSIKKDKRIIAALECRCRDCEYNVTDEDHNESGFKICWQEYADVKPHILELGQLGNINKKENIINHLISNRKVSIFDVPLKFVEGKYNNRPFYQITQKSEILLPDFEEVLESINYPLYFIDFETSQMAIPYHKDMRPYGKVIFQWSCHIIIKPGDIPTHYEWINTEEYYPNFKFGESLMDCLGDKGTIMTWSYYENTQLKNIYYDCQLQQHDNKKLETWLLKTAKHFDGDDTRILDLNDVCKKYYFHPEMKGRTSIKITLPAVLKAVKNEKIRKLLKNENLFALDENGFIINPYDLLPHIEIFDKAENVKNGSGAMRAYQDMLYGIHKSNPKIKDEYKNALLRYCKLDTLAMVIIWEHWMDLFNMKYKNKKLGE